MKEEIRIEMNKSDDEVDDVILLAQMKRKQGKRLAIVLYMNVFAMLLVGFLNWFYEVYWLAIIDAVIGLFSLWLIGRNKTEMKKCWIIEQTLKRYKEDKAELLK